MSRKKPTTHQEPVRADLLTADESAIKVGGPAVLYSLIALGKLKPRINQHRLVRFDRVEIETVLATYRINETEIEIVSGLESVKAALAECERRMRMRRAA